MQGGARNRVTVGIFRQPIHIGPKGLSLVHQAETVRDDNMTWTGGVRYLCLYRYFTCFRGNPDHLAVIQGQSLSVLRVHGDRTDPSASMPFRIPHAGICIVIHMATR